MKIFLFIGFFIIVLFVFFWFRRDREYEKRDIREVVTPEMRKQLNLVTDDDQFKRSLSQSNGKEKSSRQILEAMNEEQEG